MKDKSLHENVLDFRAMQCGIIWKMAEYFLRLTDK